jgi:hypothetical protein
MLSSRDSSPSLRSSFPQSTSRRWFFIRVARRVASLVGARRRPRDLPNGKLARVAATGAAATASTGRVLALALSRVVVVDVAGRRALSSSTALSAAWRARGLSSDDAPRHTTGGGSSTRRLAAAVFVCRASSSSSSALAAATSSSSEMPADDAASARVLLWFRGTDLRLRDNLVVDAASALVASGSGDVDVLPVFCFDPRTFAASAWGTPKTGGRRARFLLESVLDLKRSLRDVGSDLLVAVGKPEDVIPRYLLEGGTNVVLTQVRRRRRSLAASSARPSSRPGRRRPSVGSR